MKLLSGSNQLIIKFKGTLISLVSAACLFCIGQNTIAGGFQLSDHSVTSLGRAHAGYGVVGDDASVIHFNPSGLTLFTSKQVQGGLTYNNTSAPFTDDGSTTLNTGANDDGAQDSLVPNFYYSMPLNERLHIGVGVTAPFGTHTDYSNDFIGRYNGLKTELVATDINPVVAYKVNDSVSVGGGISLQTLDVTLSQAVTFSLSNPTTDGSFTVEGDSDINFGYNLGVMFTLDDESRFGISYRSAIEHDIEGESVFTTTPGAGTFDATSFFESPATSYIGYHKALSRKLNLSLGARWTEWSSFKEIKIEFPNGNDLGGAPRVTDISWNNSWTYMLGIDGVINDNLGWRAGLAFDKTPVPSSTRSVRTVDADRTWYSIGSTYKTGKKGTFDIAYRYISFDDVSINQETANAQESFEGDLKGDFNSSRVHTIALQYNYKF